MNIKFIHLETFETVSNKFMTGGISEEVDG